jgi:hypothetical protein
MEKTIEAIWQEGFLDDKAPIAPKLNDLYNQKSSNIVDKMTHMFKINLLALAAFAIVALITCVAVGLPYVGATLFTLFALLVVVGKRDLRSLEAIDKGVNSYEYIKAFNNWLKGNIARFSMIYRFFYPVLFVGIVLGLWFSHHGEKMLKKVIEIRPEIYLCSRRARLLGISSRRLHRDYSPHRASALPLRYEAGLRQYNEKTR